MQRRNVTPKDGLASCSNCTRADGLSTQRYADTVDYRHLPVDVEGLERTKCQACGHIFVTAEQAAHNQIQIKAAYATERDRLRVQYGFLTGDQISHLRERLDINQREASALFGGGPNAFNKYESGEVLQSYAMDRLLRLAAAIGKAAVTFLRNVDGPLVLPATAVPRKFIRAIAPRHTIQSTYFEAVSHFEAPPDNTNYPAHATVVKPNDLVSLSRIRPNRLSYFPDQLSSGQNALHSVP